MVPQMLCRPGTVLLLKALEICVLLLLGCPWLMLLPALQLLALKPLATDSADMYAHAWTVLLHVPACSCIQALGRGSRGRSRTTPSERLTAAACVLQLRQQRTILLCLAVAGCTCLSCSCLPSPRQRAMTSFLPHDYTLLFACSELSAWMQADCMYLRCICDAADSKPKVEATSASN